MIASRQDMADFSVSIAKKFENSILANSKILNCNCIALKGDLGSGKSFFARHFIKFLSDQTIEIPSPTFNLVYAYETRIGKVYHFDLYRLKTPDELENIGFFEALKNGLVLIEWPEIAHEFLPKNRLEIAIANLCSKSISRINSEHEQVHVSEDDNQREITVNNGKFL